MLAAANVHGRAEVVHANDDQPSPRSFASSMVPALPLAESRLSSQSAAAMANKHCRDTSSVVDPCREVGLAAEPAVASELGSAVEPR